jgi:flavin-dependent dehydrogenase
MKTVDVIIAGAGPAGLSVALHLIRQDPSWAERLLVLEKTVHPRHKLCGGGMTRLGLQVLKDLGFELPLPLPQAPVDDIRLVYRNRTLHVRGKPQFVVFHRMELDAYLAAEARQRGVRICENEAVKDFQVDENGVRVDTEQGAYRAQVLVGADGSKGVLRAYFNRMERRSRTARLLETFHSAQIGDSLFRERYALFDFTPVDRELQGYFWDFPAYIQGQPFFNRGIYDARMVSVRPKAVLPGLLRQELEALDVTLGEIQGHPIHWFSPSGRFSLPRLLLVGDAAGVDPLFGEGIAPALAYGLPAAQAITEALARRNFSFRDYRRRVLSAPVGRYLLLRWAVAWGCYRMSFFPWFMHFVWSLGSALAALWPAPEQLYPEDRGLYGKEANLADQ